MTTPPEVALLAAQLDTTMEIFTERLIGLTDEEYFWEPVPGSWSLRPRGTQLTPRGYGKGDLVFDYDAPPPEPSPMRTIAWLLMHISQGCLMRSDYTIGDRKLTFDDMECPATAAAALENLEYSVGRYRAIFDEVPADEFAQVGRSSFPWGLDPTLPLRDILWWQNREVIHHAAEVSMLRDLYAWRAPQ
jgi:hypothetical protein